MKVILWNMDHVEGKRIFPEGKWKCSGEKIADWFVRGRNHVINRSIRESLATIIGCARSIKVKYL